MLKILKKCLRTNSILCTIIFILGYNTSKIIPFNYFTISKEVNIVEVFSILITILLAIYITRILEKQKDQKRFEKEIVFSKINELNLAIATLKERINLNNVELGTILFLLKKSYGLTKFINDILVNYSIYNCSTNKDSILHEIKEIKRILTTTPINSTSIDISVLNNIVTYSNSLINTSIQKCSNLENQITLWQLEINKS